MQHSVSVGVKDISFESFLSDLLFIGIYCELQREGVWVEGKETAVRYNVAGMASLISNELYDLQCFTIYSVHCA